MAYVNEEEDKKAATDQQQNQLLTPMTASAPGAGPSSSAGKSAPQATPAQPFQNLSAYLTANQPQVETQANQLADKLTGQYGDIKSGVDQNVGDFKNTVASSYAKPDPDLVDQAVAAPSDFVKNPQNVAAFQSLYNDQYGGPQNFESSSGYADLDSRINKATSEAANLGTPGGLKTYFQNQNPNATAGGNLLDSTLLQGTPTAYTKVLDAAKPFASLNDYLSGAVTSADNDVTNAKTEAQRIADETHNKFVGAGGAIPTLQQDLSGRLEQLRGSQKTLFDRAMGDLTSGTVTDEDATSLGIDKDTLQGLIDSNKFLQSDYGVPAGNLEAFFNAKAPDIAYPDLSYVSTPDEAARASALAQLTGTSPLTTGSNTPGSLSSFDAQGARQQTTEKLRNMDLQTIGNAVKNAPLYAQFGADPLQAVMFLSNNPDVVQKFQNTLPPDQAKIFTDAINRLGIGNTTTPVQPTDTGTGGGNLGFGGGDGIV